MDTTPPSPAPEPQPQVARWRNASEIRNAIFTDLDRRGKVKLMESDSPEALRQALDVACDKLCEAGVLIKAFLEGRHRTGWAAEFMERLRTGEP